MLFTLGLCLCLCLEPPVEWQKDRYHQTIKVQENQPIAVTNLYGDLHLRSSNLPEMEVIVNTQTLKSDPVGVKISHEVEDGVLHLHVYFPELETVSIQRRELLGKSRRVDLTCFLPKHVPLTITGKDGKVKGKGLDNQMAITTKNGPVSIRNRQGAVIKTYQGAIEYFLGSSDIKGPVTFTSIVGPITYWVPVGSNMEIKADTKGDICSDFSMKIDSSDNEMKKHATIILGSGEKKVTIGSVQGNLRIKKQINESSY